MTGPKTLWVLPLGDQLKTKEGDTIAEERGECRTKERKEKKEKK